MKRLIGLFACLAPLFAAAGEFSSTLVVQTGFLREGDLIVRNITDLEARKTCMTFYVRTAGTSPVTDCYDVVDEFGADVRQAAHLKEGELVIRKVEDTKNNRACLVAYVSTPGTSPAVHCYTSTHRFKEGLQVDSHLREGDLDVHRISDPNAGATCLVAFVKTEGTAPSTFCYPSIPQGIGPLRQEHTLKEGDLVVRKVTDGANNKACLISYVSTEGTSSRMFCFDHR
ncbi:MAG: hypothetical protein LGR52_11630 [Candidatus Thiosymbion ectosymbiont of Robbea hypermnestra]|nr:hypothetical protein [Candidatus Thiosymbion ectosymbiont of Robbea hypermnestra]